MFNFLAIEEITSELRNFSELFGVHADFIPDIKNHDDHPDSNIFAELIICLN